MTVYTEKCDMVAKCSKNKPCSPPPSDVHPVGKTTFHVASHSPDNLQFDREPRSQQTTRRIFLAQASGILSTAILVNGIPAPSLSAVTFFVNFNSRATICHHVPHKPLRPMQSRPTFASQNSVPGNT